jgi:hypothetical protein
VEHSNRPATQSIWHSVQNGQFFTGVAEQSPDLHPAARPQWRSLNDATEKVSILDTLLD